MLNNNLINNEHPYATAVLVITPAGIPLVRDPKKPQPALWKLPGGRSEGDETPEQAAIREVLEETGITLAIDQLQKIKVVNKVNHQVWFFQAELPLTPTNIKKIGNEGEEVALFSADDIIKMTNFFPNHRLVVEQLLIALSNY